MLEGRFVQEKKNRFLCEVVVDGSLQECYIPASCHLSHFINLQNKIVYLKENASSNARTRFSVYGVRIGHRCIPLQLAISNKIIFDNIESSLFSFLGSRKNVTQEKMVDGYKCDLFIDDTKTIIEIKSIIEMSDIAVFPSVYSERANKQLSALLGLLEKGYKVCYFFISLNPQVHAIRINDNIPEFYKPFSDCINKNMTVRGYSIKMNTSGKTSLYKEIGIVQ